MGTSLGLGVLLRIRVRDGPAENEEELRLLSDRVILRSAGEDALADRPGL